MVIKYLIQLLYASFLLAFREKLSWKSFINKAFCLVKQRIGIHYDVRMEDKVSRIFHVCVRLELSIILNDFDLLMILNELLHLHCVSNHG